MRLRHTVCKVGFFVALFGVALAGPVQAQGNDTYTVGVLASETGDYATAASQWQSLAAKGDAIAQFNLALLHHSGQGVSLDEAVAVSWYHRSAENGYSKAQEFLVAAYREGWFGLAQDAQKAEYWSRQLEKSSF